jgi:predicted solute-binding protein
VIGDPALFLDATSAGFTKIDLGAEWTRTTGLPFVWAFWAARPDALDARHLAALTTARDEGVAHADEIADAYGPERAALCRAYLRDNIKYAFGPREIAGVERYYELAAAHRLVDRSGPVRFFDR